MNYYQEQYLKHIELLLRKLVFSHEKVYVTV
ncbi:hypothetical protein DM860_008992 [Cuscuta australis]|uniref:Uncharacterized protein n=1 Tax=Cuscuta australis TaxID=267555 RepID=A0A328D9H0_9ASTE|nr:hypothetical protein DM860_008992 [Cuscuta australis]